MFDYNLSLFTGIDIPIPELQAVLHQPSIKEISYLGEQDFFLGISLLCLNKSLYIQDKSLLESTSNFQIFMMILKEKEMQDKKTLVIQVLEMLFPKKKIAITPNSILFIGEETTFLDENNFDNFQEILKKIFCLSDENNEQKIYNPKGKKAQQIAEKIMRARQRIAQQRAKDGKSMLGQYVSVITTGFASMSLKDSLDLTIFQVYDLMERYSLYINWDIDLRTRLAGGKPDKQAENWMKQIH